MLSKKFYVVTTIENVTDVKVLGIYDGDVLTLDSIVAGYQKKLSDDDTDLTVMGNNAYIDVFDENGIITQTYSIVSKVSYITKLVPKVH